MILPCRHIFALRKKLECTLYDEQLCDRRWTSEYYQDNQRMFVDVSSAASESVEVTQVTSKPARVLSQHQKYRKAVVFTSELASVISEASGIHFDRPLRDL